MHPCRVSLVPKFDWGTHTAEALFRDGRIEKHVVQTTDSQFRPCRDNCTTKLSFLEVRSVQKASKVQSLAFSILWRTLGMSSLASLPCFCGEGSGLSGGQTKSSDHGRVFACDHEFTLPRPLPAEPRRGVEKTKQGRKQPCRVVVRGLSWFLGVGLEPVGLLSGCCQWMVG